MASDRQYFDIDDMTTAEQATADRLFAANREAAKAKAELAKSVADRLGLAEGTLKVYAKWGKISGEIVEAQAKPKAKAKQSLAEFIAAQQASGLRV